MDRFDCALLYAIDVHGGQVRKGTSTSYVTHLLAVAAIVDHLRGQGRTGRTIRATRSPKRLRTSSGLAFPP
jgi:hypothetical protein